MTFSDIQELQATNHKLLTVVRELSSKHEQDEEEREHAKVKELKVNILFIFESIHYCYPINISSC